MTDQLTTSNSDQSMLSREVNRRNFLRGATSQVVKHSLITVPAVALVLSGAAIPVSFAQTYTKGDTAVVDSTQFIVTEGRITIVRPPCEQSFLDRLIDSLKKIFGSSREVTTQGTCTTIRG